MDVKKILISSLTLKRLGIGLVLLTPAIITLLLIHNYSINVPISDQYALVPMFQSLDHGHIPWGALWAQHNEHRIFFPNVILLSLARLTHWNTFAELYLSFLIACIGFIGIVCIIKRHIKSPKLSLTTILIAAIVFFSPVQGENWLWGWQLEWFFCAACIIWTVNLLDSINKEKRLRALLLPVALAFVASFSLGGGFFVWFVGLLMLIIKRCRINQIILWLVGSLLSIGLYFFHYTFLDGKNSHLITPIGFIKNYLAYIGRPISDNSHIAVFFGLFFVIAFGAVLFLTIYSKQVEAMSSVISIGLMSLIFGLLIGISRFNFGIVGALSSVHTTFSLLLIISIIILTINAVNHLNIRIPKAMPIMNALTITLILTLSFTWLNGINTMKTQYALDDYVYNCSRVKNPTGFCLYEIYSPNSQDAKNWLDYLKQKHYGGY